MEPLNHNACVEENTDNVNDTDEGPTHSLKLHLHTFVSNPLHKLGVSKELNPNASIFSSIDGC